MFAVLVPGYNKSFFERLIIAGNIKNTLKQTKDDGKKCYIIKVNDNNVTRTIWLNEKATPYKGEVVFNNGKIFKYEYNIKFNQVTLKSIELPRIDDYKVVNAETNEIIQEQKNNE